MHNHTRKGYGSEFDKMVAILYISLWVVCGSLEKMFLSSQMHGMSGTEGT